MARVGTGKAAASIDVTPAKLRRWAKGDGLPGHLPPPPHLATRGDYRTTYRFDLEALAEWNERRLEPVRLAERIASLTFFQPGEERTRLVRKLSRRPVDVLRREVAWWEAADA